MGKPRFDFLTGMMVDSPPGVSRQPPSTAVGRGLWVMRSSGAGARSR